MRRILLLLILCVLILSEDMSNAFAEKQEWYDEGFNFTRVKKIAVMFQPSDRLNLLQGNEAFDLFMEKMKTDLIDELPPGKYKFESAAVISEKILQESGVDVASIAETNVQEADRIAYEYIKKHYDLFVVWSPLIYDVGSQYCEGYVYSTPTTNTSTVWLPNGGTAMVTTHGNSVHSVPGGNYPAVYVAVRVDVINPKDNQPVWMRIDDRVRVNKTIFDNTKPRDVYQRILESFIEDFERALEERIGTKSKAKF